MAQGFETLDALFPTFTGNESPRQMVRELSDYLYQQTQALQFLLSNLNTKNWNQKDLQAFQEATTAQVAGDIKKINEKISNIEKAVEALQKLPEQVKANTDGLSDLTTKVSGISGKVENLLKTFQGDGEGGGSIGKEGQRLDLIGLVYVNGKPVS